MKHQIEKLEDQLKELKAVYENEQRVKYETSEHKHFEEGDIVTNGDTIAIVKWTENKIIGLGYEKGYFGGSIINGSRGFATFKRDEFEIVTDEYFTKQHQLSITLTGLEIEEIKYSIVYCNPYKSKSKLLDCLDAVR